MSPCIASHLPPPLNEGGGASATAFRTALNFPLTDSGHPKRNERAGTDSVESTSTSWKYSMNHGCIWFLQILRCSPTTLFALYPSLDRAFPGHLRPNLPALARFRGKG